MLLNPLHFGYCSADIPDKIRRDQHRGYAGNDSRFGAADPDHAHGDENFPQRRRIAVADLCRLHILSFLQIKIFFRKNQFTACKIRITGYIK